MNLHRNKEHMPRWVGSAVMVTVQLLLWTTQTGCSQLPSNLHVNNSDLVNSKKTANYAGGRRSNNLILNDLNNNSLFKKLKEKNAKSETVITTSQGKVKPKISKVQNQNMDNRVDQQGAASSSKQNNISFKKEDLATHNQSLKKSKSLEDALNELDDLIIWLNAL